MSVRPATRCVVLALIIAGAALLRIRHIGYQSLWADEGLTARILRLPAGAMLQRIRDWEQTPPLYYYLLKPWVMFFGMSERALRLPSALFGTLAVAAMYLLMRRAAGTTAGLVAAALLAVSPYQIAYSQEARAYALLVLLAAVSSYLFLRLLDESTQKLQTWYVIVTALLLYTHLYGIFVVAAHNLTYLTALIVRRNRRIDLARWVSLNVAVAFLYSPWFHTIWIWVRTVQTGFWVKSVTIHDIAWAYYVYAGSISLLLMLVALAVIVAWRGRDRTITVLWLSMMLLPVLVPVVISIMKMPGFSARYGMAASIGLYALAATGVAAVPGLTLRIVMSIALITLSFLPSFVPELKPQWREAAAYLQKNMQAGDFAAINHKGATCMYDYYVHRPDVARIGFDGGALPVTQPLPDEKHIWLILYTNDWPAAVLLRRGQWDVISQKAFREVLVLELADRL